MRISKSGSPGLGNKTIMNLLAKHRGDSARYLKLDEENSQQCDALEQAKAFGFVTDDGILTPSGYAYWRQQSTF